MRAKGRPVRACTVATVVLGSLSKVVSHVPAWRQFTHDGDLSCVVARLRVGLRNRFPVSSGTGYVCRDEPRGQHRQCVMGKVHDRCHGGGSPVHRPKHQNAPSSPHVHPTAWSIERAASLNAAAPTLAEHQTCVYEVIIRIHGRAALGELALSAARPPFAPPQTQSTRLGQRAGNLQ